MNDHPIRLLVDSASPRFVERVKAVPEAARFEILSYVGCGEEGLRAAIETADAAYIYQDQLTGDAIRAAPRLKFIQKHGLNCKNIDVATATARSIPVATLPLFRNSAVAEHALALMLACAHKLIPSHHAVVEAEYKQRAIQPIFTTQREYRANWAEISGIAELAGASVGIVGLGDIGMEIARRCNAFDMDVFYHQRQRHDADVEEMYSAQYLPFRELLERIDYLVLVLPHTTETENLIGARELAHMKPTTTIINVARGGVIDEVALIDALRSGQIAMAGLDVYRREPLPFDSPLIALPNVVLTPHTGGGSGRSRTIDRSAALANIQRLFDGSTPKGVLNL